MHHQPNTWLRVVLCGLVVGGVWTLLSIILLTLVGADFLAAVKKAQLNTPSQSTNALLLLSNLLAGVWAMWLYTAIRPRFGPGPKTALIAGLAWWIIVSMQSAKWAALISVPSATIPPLLATTLVAILASILLGAWFYEK